MNDLNAAKIEILSYMISDFYLYSLTFAAEFEKWFFDANELSVV